MIIINLILFKRAIRERKTVTKLLDGSKSNGTEKTKYQSYATPIFNSKNPNECEYILRVVVKIELDKSE